MNDTQKTRLILPQLQGLYDNLTPLFETLMRVMAGVALMAHGWGKVLNPMGAVGMVEKIGFYPGVFWSPLLSFTEFGAGLLLVLGLLTRPAAAASSVILLVTVYFHWIMLDQGYKGSELSLIWITITLLLLAKGAGKFSLDRVIGREF